MSLILNIAIETKTQENSGRLISSMYTQHNGVKIIQRTNCVEKKEPSEESKYNKRSYFNCPSNLFYSSFIPVYTSSYSP